MSYEIKNTTRVLDGTLFHVDAYQLQDGKAERTHLNVFRNPTVSVFPLSETGEIYLAKQYRYLVGEETLEAVAGFIDPGEQPLEAAQRELREETGLIANRWDSLGIISLGSSVLQAKSHLYLARDLVEGEQDLQGNEAITVVKFPFEQAFRQVEEGVINTASSVIGLQRIEKMKREGMLDE